VTLARHRFITTIPFLPTFLSLFSFANLLSPRATNQTDNLVNLAGTLPDVVLDDARAKPHEWRAALSRAHGQHDARVLTSIHHHGFGARGGALHVESS
jgi:hypothetical protein